MEINRKEGQLAAFAASDPVPPGDVDDVKPSHSTGSPVQRGPELAPSAAAHMSSPLRSDALHTWRRIGEQLSAVIGESGFCALFERAVRLLAAL